MNYRFPFGARMKDVELVDRNEKRFFVFGVYASAIPARWLGTDKKSRVQATIGSKSIELIPLVYSRQVDRLGSSSRGWGELHDTWLGQRLRVGYTLC